MMRQAGRYLPEYRALKEKHDFLTLCKTPELAVEVTLQPIRRLPVDAAILFSDILIPVEPMGVGLRFDPGPILERAIRDEETIASLRPVDVERDCGFVMEAIRLLRRQLDPSVALIGFAGAPFTVAAYLAEDWREKAAKGTFGTIARMLFERPDLARRLLDHVASVTADYLSAQIRAGAQAVQIFDSWGGILGREHFRDFALAYVRRVIQALPSERGPVIYFVLNGGHLLDLMADSGADVVGVDWRTSLSIARQVLAGSPVTALQGNLDPHALFAPAAMLEAEIRRVLLEGMAGTPTMGTTVAGAQPRGHVFNLGHGILPDTPLEAAENLVRMAHEISEQLYAEAAPGPLSPERTQTAGNIPNQAE